MAKPIIAVSACLCGIGRALRRSSRTDARLERLWREGLALAVCPRMHGRPARSPGAGGAGGGWTG